MSLRSYCRKSASPPSGSTPRNLPGKMRSSMVRVLMGVMALLSAHCASGYYTNSAAAQDFVRFNGVKCDGSAGGNVRIANLRDVRNREACAELCSRDPKCHVASYQMDTETCRTFSACAAYEYTDGYSTAVLERLDRKVLGRFWTVVRGEGCIRNKASDCMKVTITSTLKETLPECRKACEAEDLCEAIHFLKRTGLCQLLRQQTQKEHIDEINEKRIVVGVVVPQWFNPAVAQRQIHG